MRRENADDEAVDEWLTSANALTGLDPRVRFSQAAAHLEDGRGNGDIVLELLLEDGTLARDIPGVRSLVDGGDALTVEVLVPLEVVDARTVAWEGSRVKRTLLISVMPETPFDQVARLEAALVA